MKIIGVDNYARDCVSDILICENVGNEFYASAIVKALNALEGQGGYRFYKVVDDSYQLYVFEP